jgi:hypothetical protein
MFRAECSDCGLAFTGASGVVAEHMMGHECTLPKARLPMTGYARQARWREKNRDRYNEYQRDLMQCRRKDRSDGLKETLPG